MLGLKVMTGRMCGVLADNGAQLEVFGDADVRLRDGTNVTGYVAVLEDAELPGPVHSLWRGRRSHRLVVSGDVRKALTRARLTGLEYEPVPGPFPADDPAFFDD
jgi:hypothetical protein